MPIWLKVNDNMQIWLKKNDNMPFWPEKKYAHLAKMNEKIQSYMERCHLIILYLSINSDFCGFVKHKYMN